MARRRNRRPLICSIGSTDPTGTAGVGLDLRVYAEFGADGALAVAGVTAQNAAGVRRVTALDPPRVIEQLEAIWDEREPDAIRIGLLPNARVTAALTAFLNELESRPPIVVDPVIASTSGYTFAGPEEIAALLKLARHSDLLTPNAAEAHVLSGLRVDDLEGARRAARALSELGCAVLVKGGHLPGSRVVDVLARDGAVAKEFGARRLAARRRGTGCLLAAAIAVQLARDRTHLELAIQQARSFVRAALTKR